jgi:hypothetical protein
MMSVEPTYTISTVKALIRQREGIPPAKQRLIFASADLENGYTLEDYNIQKDDTIYLSLSIAGGGKRGRGVVAAAENDRNSQIAKATMEFNMVTTSLARCEVPFIAATTQQLMARDGIEHANWLRQCMDRLTTPALKELADKLKASSNPDQRVRHVVKLVFAQELEQSAKATLILASFHQMRGGLLDTYTGLAMAHAYMGNEGEMNWTTFTNDIDNLVANRLRGEGAAAAAGRR